MDFKYDQWKDMYSLGIMTLTRTPCELDKMSLFQDLKLKRRKVDSRCSSDGESIADTSTSSSHDLLCPPASPKTDGPASHHQEGPAHRHQEGHAYHRHQESPAHHRPPPSPDSMTPHPLGHAHHDRGPPAVERSDARLDEPGVFDGGGGGGGDGGGTASVIRHLPVIRSLSPPTRPAPQFSPSQPPRPHSSPGRHAPASPRASPVIRHTPLLLQPPASPRAALACQEPTSSSMSLLTAPTPRGVIIAQPTAPFNQHWLKHSRINGVKPEIIGGTFVNPPAPPSPRNNPAARQTPTVIMGEAGGVRTMIWSQPSLTPPLGEPTTSGWPVATNTDETAAQLLLNLGQDRLRPASRCLGPPTSPTSQFTSAPLNMERLWAGDLCQLPAGQQTQALNLTAPILAPPGLYRAGLEAGQAEQIEEEEQPMICMICEDKATGLHYGIITCEGCKGFFKRTVQNRRVYTCVADGNCEITKAQRNRCQYCRFKKCIEQGMVLQAVREDRMPGGRNSGAVYNLYKVKYKKHKKPTTKQQQQHQQKSPMSPQQQYKQDQQFKQEQAPMGAICADLVNGTILKTALTNPSEVVRFRQRVDSAVSSSRDRNFSVEYSLSMIKTLIDCDEFQDIATLRNLDELLDHNTDLGEKLCNIGDSIVYKLVQWTKRLPFYLELPVEVHTRLLTHKWHELLVLTTSAYQAIHKVQGEQQIAATVLETDFSQEVESNLCTLQNCLISMMGREITIEQLRQDVGLMIERITHVTLMFRQIKLTMEEYVCLKVITMLNQAKSASSSGPSELEIIHERYMTCLRVYTQHMYPQQATRFQDLLVRLPEIQSAASLLLESKMFYVPFLLNSAIQR
ncbi:unnamed protein product [Phaedon cochleariae]|uniref:Hormone receptor 4 n=1 Tax=Phaedon cochleariae TaxID=80249 RepID=A0A9N9SHV8_PHACE|nr:unnamed protein product [Phaedon cochleariae]